jgi:hypothetical protein
VNDWFRSLSILGIAFGGVVVITFGLAALIVPGAAGSARASGDPVPGASGGAPVPAEGPVTAVGGVLTVTGDREGSFVLDREEIDSGYALAGEHGSLHFGGDPLTVERISYDGLEFYVDPGGCTLTPGERHDPTGVAGADVRCEDLEDIRDGGTLTIEGEVGMAADLLGLRGDLPPSGGTVEIGDREIELPFAVVTVGRPIGFGPVGGFVSTDDSSSWLMFDYDFQTHALRLVVVALDGVETEVDRGACDVSTEEIGRLNPHTTTADLRLECAAVELESGETVRIGGTIVADLVEPPQPSE